MWQNPALLLAGLNQSNTISKWKWVAKAGKIIRTAFVGSEMHKNGRASGDGESSRAFVGTGWKRMMRISATIVTAMAVLALAIGNIHLQAQLSTNELDVFQTEDDLAVMIQAVEATTPAPASSVPRKGLAGTFYSAQHAPGTRFAWPPLPANVNQFPVWNLGDGLYLLADENYSYDAPVVTRNTATSKSSALTMDVSGAPVPGGGGTNSGSYSPADSPAPVNYGTNLCLIQISTANGGLLATASNTISDVLYEIQTNADLTTTNWGSFGFFNGSEITNFTFLSSIPVSTTSNMFFRIRSWQDSMGTGIPDWWWLTYFGQVTNVDAYAPDPVGDGYTDWEKFAMGINPNIYYNPRPVGGFFGSLDATGTNVDLGWSNAPGPVVNYLVQRAINHNGTYDYTSFLLSSNAIFFKDTGVVTNADAQYDIYSLTAVYPGGVTSGTNVWDVYYYATKANSGPPYGPPLPQNVYASADATGTNVVITWSSASSLATNYVIQRGVYNTNTAVWSYTLIASVSSNVYSDAGAITNDNGWNNVYLVQAGYAGGGLSASISTHPGSSNIFSSVHVGANTNGPAAPTNFCGYTDATGTNLSLTWSPVPGSVSNYVLYSGILDSHTDLITYHRLGAVGSGTNIFNVAGGVDVYGNALYPLYSVVAVYTNGSLSQSATWTSTNGAVYAWLDATGTNVELAWTAAPGSVTGYLVQRFDDIGAYTYTVGVASAQTTFLTDTDAVGYGYFDTNQTFYGVQAMYPDGGLSSLVYTMVSSAPAAPTGLTAVIDSTGTNVFLNWTPALGQVVNYAIKRGILNTNTGQYSYSQIGLVSGAVTNFEDVGAINDVNSYNDVYEVEAVYAGGSTSEYDTLNLSGVPTPPPATAPVYNNIHTTAYLVRNGTGRWQIMFSGAPTNSAQAVQLTWTNSNGGVVQQTISTTNLVLGVYAIPDAQVVNLLGDSLSVQMFGPMGEPGQIVPAGTLANDAPYFVDGRQHMKQNLEFMIRGASDSLPFSSGLTGFYFNHFVIYGDPFFSQFNQGLTNYEEFSFLYGGGQQMDDLWPFKANFDLCNYLVDTTRTNPTPFGTTNFVFIPNFATNIPAPAILTHADPYWILQQAFYPNEPDYTAPDWDVTVNAAQTQASLASSGNNLFGLSYQAGCEVDMQNVTSVRVNCNYQILSPGDTVTARTNFTIGDYASWCPAPSLQLSSYYFAPLNYPSLSALNPPIPNQQLYPTPISDGFTVTNQTPPLIVGSVGQPMMIGGWAKYAIQGSSPTKYAYLGQYFVTNAFLLDANGDPTTNGAGVVSPYGEFFPLQAGQAQFVTMPDVDPPYEQGTCTVAVISINADANHDGAMDLSYFGPDQTSPSRPFRFWVNDDQDSGDYGGDGIPGRPGSIADGFSFSERDANYNPVYRIHGTRDLVDFFPVCLNLGSLFQSNALSAGIDTSDTNYQFILSQADGVLRFDYTDLTPTNYMDFLRDTNEARNLGGYYDGVNYFAADKLTTITNVIKGGVALSQSFLSGIATGNRGIILVEAAAPTTQPLVLTIYHGTNQIAQTRLYLSISGVEQMFRSKNLLLYPESGTVPDRLSDADVPNEPDTTDMNFILVHGYNVNPQQARGWDADLYKRLYWSGSHAKFYGVTWEASDSQVAGQVTMNLQTNIVHAFDTAPLLSTFINSLSGTNVVAAHSLGNMLVLSTLNDCSNQNIRTYCMIDAAVAIEAIETNAPPNPDMYSSAWTNYDSRLWASGWHNLFSAGDARSALTWNGRLANFNGAQVYNFFSSGEEVLRDYPGDPPESLIGIVEGQFVSLWKGETGEYTWAWQEKLKGLMPANFLLSSDHGGWQFNPAYSSLSFAQADALTNSMLMTNAFFNPASFSASLFPFDSDLALETSSGNSYAQTNKNRILSDAIPCLTLPVGANPVPRLSPPSSPVEMNFDMQTQFENGWPFGRGLAKYPPGTTAAGEWHHSDNRAIAYTFTWPFFDKIVSVGHLK